MLTPLADDAAAQAEPEQLALEDVRASEHRSRWRRLRCLVHDAIEVAAAQVGQKHVASDLGVSPAELSNGLAERERHHLRGEWLLYAVVHGQDRGVELVAYLASLRGYELRRARPRDAARRVAAWERAVSRLLPAEMRVVLERAVEREERELGEVER